jgi:DNA-binding LacI/PurR family transcriptional regulator
MAKDDNSRDSNSKEGRSKEAGWSLYNHPIRTTFRLTLAEQVYDALCREIHAGRWQIGDRLPGASALAEMSGLSHNVVQRALEALREDGYVRQEKRRGTFLQSHLPRGAKSKGVIGIAMTKSEELSNYHFDHVYLSRMHAVIKGATDRGYTTEVQCLPDGDNGWDTIDVRGACFSERVVAIISLHPFPRYTLPAPEEERLPLVFFEAPGEDSRPTVHHDAVFAAYQAVRLAIEAGHRDIVLYAGHPHPDCGFGKSYEGYERAMREAGLAINEKAIEQSLTHHNDDLTLMRQFLVEHGSATALFTLTSAKARRFVALCDVLGIDIPGDLTLISQASAPMRNTDDQKMISGSRARTSETVMNCFAVLEEMMQRRTTARRRIVLQPDAICEHTLGPPRLDPLPVLQSFVGSRRVPERV